VLRLLGELAPALVATRSSNERALAADLLAERARPWFHHVEAVDDPVAALSRGHELGEPVLVTGSLYLLADLAARRPAGVP
jgi:folylpolyglutamate synthase/dihydropteroate synthase